MLKLNYSIKYWYFNKCKVYGTKPTQNHIGYLLYVYYSYSFSSLYLCVIYSYNIYIYIYIYCVWDNG